MIGRGANRGEVRLSRLEHSLLSTTADVIAPLYSLYDDVMREIEGADLEQVLQALMKLVELGLCRCLLDVKNRGWEPVEHLNIEDLRRRCSGHMEEKYLGYPDVIEYWFEITDKGRKEEARDIYEVYYQDDR